MELRLHEQTAPVFTPIGGDIQIAQLTWAFWIKAGIGFTIGAAIATLLLFLFWVTVLAGIGTTLLRGVR